MLITNLPCNCTDKATCCNGRTRNYPEKSLTQPFLYISWLLNENTRHTWLNESPNCHSSSLHASPDTASCLLFDNVLTKTINNFPS